MADIFDEVAGNSDSGASASQPDIFDHVSGNVDENGQVAAVHSPLEDLITGHRQKQIPSLLEHPIDALTSKDWWLTDNNGVQRSPMQSAAGAPMAALDALTFGSGDEITAGANAGIDALQGHDLGDAYDQRLAQSRDIQANTPIATKLITALASANKIPLPSFVPKDAGILKKGLAIAGEGAGMGAAYGFGSGEGGLENRLKSAKDNAETGAVLSPLITALGSGVANLPGTISRIAGKTSDKIKASMLGARASDYLKSFKASGVLDEDGELTSRLKEAVKNRIDDGILDGSLNTHDIFEKNHLDNKKAGAAIGDVIEGIDNLRMGDSAADTIKVGTPKFTSAQKFIKSLGINGKDLQKELDNYVSEYKAANNGSLDFAHKEKIGLLKSVYGENGSPKEALDKYIGKDLTRHMYDSIKNIAGEDSPELQQFSKANKTFGDTEEIKPILRRQISVEEANTPTKTLKEGLRTSGGWGVPILAATELATHYGLNPGLGLIPAATLGVAKAAESPGAQLLAARAAGALSRGINSSSDFLDNNRATGPLVDALRSTLNPRSAEVLGAMTNNLTGNGRTKEGTQSQGPSDQTDKTELDKTIEELTSKRSGAGQSVQSHPFLRALQSSQGASFPFSNSNSNSGSERDISTEGLSKKRALALIKSLKKPGADMQRALAMADAGGVGVYDDGK